MIESITSEERAKQMGEDIFQHGELTREIAELKAALEKIGENLAIAANVLLSDEPEKLLFVGQTSDARFSQGTIIRTEQIDGSKIRLITSELREKIVRHDDLVRQLNSRGANLPLY